MRTRASSPGTPSWVDHGSVKSLGFVLVALCLAAAPSARAGEVPLSPQTPLSSGLSAPIDARLADLDGDGDRDIVFSSRDANLVGWLEQTGSGFTQRSIESLTSPTSVIAADLDGDGDLDVTATSDSQQRVRWYESDGASPPGFTARDVTTTADGAEEVFAADVDRDGKLDLVSVAKNDDEIAWFQNDGASPPGFTRLVIDEDPDAAGSGAEGFLNGPAGVLVFDPDRDGDPDVAAIGLSSLVWFENANGLGTSWSPHTAASGLATGTQLSSADLDRDGDADLVAAVRNDDSVYWYENDGTPDTGTWTQRTVSSAVDFGTGGNVSVGDVDGDGDVDVMAGSGVAQELYWFENDGAGVPAFTSREVAGQLPISHPAVDDLDGDGDADLVALDATSGQLRWIENQSIHRSTAFFGETLVLTTDQPRDVSTADIDGDGDLDALAVDPASAAWLENTAGDGSTWATHTIAAGNHGHALAADLDRDGDLDVLVDGALGWYENSAGDGSTWTLHSIGSASSPALADFDGDGDLDVVGERAVSDDIRWYENTGQGLTWSAVNVIATGWTLVSTVRTADMDGDGDFDVLVSGPTTPPRAAWLENDGTPGALGDWTEHTIATGSAASGTVPSESVDLDRDGDLDLAIKIDGQLRWYANQDGTGTSWGAPVLVQATASGSTRNLAALDLDADGDVDLVKAGHDDRITWHESLSGDGTSWAERRVTGLAPIAGTVAVDDVDGDGDADVLGTSIDSDTIAFYENQGGQLALPTEDASRSGGALAGTAEALLRIDAAHRGRSGDSSIQVTTLELLLEQSPGDPLSSAEANALVDELRVYQDDGSGEFDGADTQIFSQGTLTLTGGLLALDVSADADFVLAHAVPRTWFVVALLTADAASQSPNTLRVTHLTESTSAGEDASAATPVTLEFAAADSAAVTALAPLADADADGLTNQTELDTEGTDPFDADTDGDGLADGAEVNTHASDPLDSDSDDDGWLDGTEAALGSSPTVAGSLPTTPAKARLGAPQTIASGLTDADDLALADVDGDGDLDLIFKGSTALVWRENAAGDGSVWTEHDILPAAPLNQRQTVADFDRDGDLDVASLSSTVRWHANAGDGLSWSTSVVEITGVAGVAEGEAADLDRDGDADLVETLTRENRLKWYENQGGSSFVRSTITRVHWPNSAVAGDIDRDGDLDVLTSAGDIDAEPVEGQNQLAWHENLAGDASSWSTHVIESDVTSLGKAKLTDLDGDGDLDALVLAGSPQGISWYENAGGDGSLWLERALDQSISSPDSAWDLQAGDVDADGDLDVLALGFSELLWFENLSGDASTWAPRPLAFATDNGPRELVVGDIDGDGDLDVAGAHENAGIVFWSENLTVHRSAAFPAPNTIDAAPDLPNWVSAGDVDRDGDPDALIINVGVTGGIRWRANTDGAGSFGPANLIALANHARVIRLADMDRDGDPDLVTAATVGTPGLAWHENTAGDASAWSTRTISSTYPAPYGADVGDLDGDGDPDVFASSTPATGTASLAWFENTAGDGSAWSQQPVANTQGYATDVRLADVDRDGDLDAFYNDINYATIAWKENTAGDGSAWADHVIESGLTTTVPNSVEPVDLDRDGDVDVVVASAGSNNSAWFENANGSGTAWTRHALGAPAKIFRLRASDLDLDGDLDVLGAGAEADDVFVFENSAGDGSAWTAKPLGANVENPLAVDAADLDGDGDPDLLATGFEQGQGQPDLDGPVIWLENGGGQFALPTMPTAYQGMVESRARQVLAIDFAHRGRSGDSDAELAALELRLEDSAGTALTASETDNLFSQIQIRLGSPTGAVIATAAAPFAPSAGVLTLAFADADPNVQLDPTQQLQLYVVPTLTANASSAPKSQFQIEHVTESSSRAEDASADLPLSLEYEADTSSGVIQALSPSGDADSDGLANGAEADTHGTDPGNPDTDGDGASDGLEVNTLGSNPLDTDSDDDGLQDGAEVAINTDPTSADSDSDGFCDGPLPVFGCAAGDNCPAISNAAQTNSDTFAAGDVCQCGDVTGDGPLTAADYERAREYVVGHSGGFFDEESCDVNGDAACDVEDLAVLDRATSGVGTVVDACEAYTSP